MMRPLGDRSRAWWRAVTGSASAAVAALGLLAGLCTLLAVVGPRADAQLRTDAFRHFILTAAATDKAVTGSVADTTLDVGQPLGLDAGLIERAEAQLRRNLRTLPLSPPSAAWSGLTTPFLPVTGYGPAAMAAKPPQVELGYRDALARNARLVAGRMPGGVPRSGPTLTLQAAVSEATARRFGLRVGSRLPLPDTSVVLAVTAIVQPRDPAASFWTLDPVLAVPELRNPLSFNDAFWAGGFFITADAVRALQSQINTGEAQVTWQFPLALGNFTAAQATQLQSTLAGALASAGHVTVTVTSQGGAPLPVEITLNSSTGQLIADFDAEAAAVGSVLDLLAVSLAVLAAVVVLLGGWLLAERRRPDFAVLRARGASRRQLVLAVAGCTAVLAVPGVAAGATMAVALTPGSSVPLSWWLAALVVVATLAGPVVVTVRTHRRYVVVVRPDAPPARVPAVRRLVSEGALVACAAGGLVVLRYQGSGAAGDVYASAAPVLLAVGVAVVVLRLYPLLVRGLLRLRGQRASAPTFLGLVRAVRVTASTTLPAFAMVLALALVSFAGMVRGAVVTGQVDTSWQQAGADAVIIEQRIVTAALQRAVAAVPGVQHVVAAAIAAGSAAGGRQFEVLAVDPRDYADLLAASPLPRLPARFTAGGAGRGGSGPVPVLASPSLAGQLGSGAVGILIADHNIQERVVGRAATMSAVPDLSGGYLVLPRQALPDAAPLPNALLVAGSGLNRAALAAAVARHGPGGTVVFRSRLLANLEDAPLQHGAYLALALGGVAAGSCGLLVLLLSLLLSASARQLALARMSTMGLSVGQGRVAGMVELLPQLLAALAGGLACAAALVPLTAPALRLGIFTGSASSVPVRIEPGWLVAAGLGLLALELMLLTGQTMLADRNVARSLRMGE